jgi:uncharacterized protein YdcH (DUF465 family)
MENHTQDEALKAHLLATDEAFRSLAEQHKQYKQAIDAKAHVTPADEIEEHRLKKLKLAVKDQMNEILAHSKHLSVS